MHACCVCMLCMYAMYVCCVCALCMYAVLALLCKYVQGMLYMYAVHQTLYFHLFGKCVAPPLPPPHTQPTHPGVPRVPPPPGVPPGVAVGKHCCTWCGYARVRYIYVLFLGKVLKHRVLLQWADRRSWGFGGAVGARGRGLGLFSS